MKRRPLDISFEAYHSGTSGSGTARYLIPQRDYIEIPRTIYPIPSIEDMLRQCEPHGLGIIVRLQSDDITAPWRLVPAYSVDDAAIAAKLSYQRGGEYWDSWLQKWIASDYQPPKVAYNRPETRLGDLIAALGN